MLVFISSSPVCVGFSALAPVFSGDDIRMPWSVHAVCPVIGHRAGGIACHPIGGTGHENALPLREGIHTEVVSERAQNARGTRRVGVQTRTLAVLASGGQIVALACPLLGPL